MKGDPTVINYLNQALKAELTAADEYLFESRFLSDWGFKKLAHGMWRDYAGDHRKQVRTFLDRVIFLDGTPVNSPNPFVAAVSVEAVFAAGLAAETAMRTLYAGAAKASDQVSDWVTEDLFVDILKKGERRIKKIETQIELIKSVGLQLYSQDNI